MTVIFQPGGAPPEGPVVAEPGTMVAVVMADGPQFGPMLDAMTHAAVASVVEGADPDGLIAALAARSAMDVAGAMFMDTALQLDGLRRRLKADEAEALGEAVKVARDLRTGAQLMIEERNRLDKLRKDAAGSAGAGTGTLDLAAARDEIGRRLACLRRAG